MRSKISGNLSPKDIILEMSEGNPGAINTMMSLMSGDPMGFIHLLTLDDMNIWGPQIWVGFKDYCDGDVARFKKALEERDPEMIKMINKECPDIGPAVTGGASYVRPKHGEPVDPHARFRRP